MLGWRDIFASRPAPTLVGPGMFEGNWSAGRPSSPAGWLPQLGRGTFERNWLAGRPSSRASPLPQLGRVHSTEIGRLAGRHRQQAGSHSWAGYIRQKLVGWQAAFASKPAPTVGPGTFERNWLAGRPSSRASPLPQLGRVHSTEIGRLAGRHREQARSHSWAGYIRQKLFGWQAAFASKPAPTVGPGTFDRNWLAGRPSSPAGWLPQKGKSKSKSRVHPPLFTTHQAER
jgi:hypothetical protein